MLTAEQRERLIQRIVLQPPTSPDQVREFQRAKTRIPNDVLLTLESMRMLADQGNRLARRIFVFECRRLGLWYDQRIWLPPARL